MNPASARIWLLAGPRPGELAQQRRLAQALGENWIEKPVFVANAKPRPAFGWTADAAPASGLVAPWPELLISFGKTLRAALWVRQASGGRCRIVHLGRPRRVAFDELDLILALPQDAMPDAPNLLHLRFPLNVPPTLSDDTRAAASARLAGLPRPWTALIVGGTTRHHRIDESALTSVARRVARGVAETGGSLLVSTSPRTPADWVAPLRTAVQRAGVPHEISEYRPGGTSSAYPEYLALADEFVLTGDTASMIADCWRSGRPVRVATLPASLRSLIKRNSRLLLPRPLREALIRRGLLAPAIDLNRWIAQLKEQGLIAGLGESQALRGPKDVADDDLQRVVERVRRLLPARS